MSTRISQQQLESYLWGAATLLRGTIDAGDYKQFIFPLLFFKRLCDVFDEETRLALKESGGDADFAAYPENHRFQVPQQAHWFEVRQTSNNVGKVLQSAMRAIEKANPDKLFGIFGDAQWTNKDRLSDSMLRDLIEHFSCLELTVANLPEDELGQGYEYLIKKFADDSGHTAAEFYTNRTVVHLMTEMLEPQSGESIYDPTCGSGGMLLSCITHLRGQKKEWRNVRLYGQERNLMTSSIARMNCFLHGIEDFQIVRGDTLSEPKLVEGDRLMRFDVVLANPPYSIKQWDRDAFASDPWGRNLYGTPPQGRADYAFWQHILQSLNPKTGRCAILFPHGVLFRQEEAEMRRKLIEADVIECVLGLGPNLFYNSPMEACVVICRMNKPSARRGRIQFINAVNEVTRERALSFLTDEHVQHIVDIYEGFKDESGFARVASTKEVRAKDFSLSIPLFVEPDPTNRTGSAQKPPLLSGALTEWLTSSDAVATALKSILPGMKLSQNGKGLYGTDTSKLLTDKTSWTPVRFGDVVENVNETESDPTAAGIERYVGLEHLEPGSLHIRTWGDVAEGTTFTRWCRLGQVLFGKRRAYQRKVAVAEFDAVVSGDIYVLASKNEQLLQELLPFICLSERFFQHAVETSAGSLSPRTNWSSLSEFQFSLPLLDQQRQITEMLWSVDSDENLKSQLAGSLQALFASELEKNLDRLFEGTCSPLSSVLVGSPESGNSASPSPSSTGHFVLSLAALSRTGYLRGNLKPVPPTKAMLDCQLSKGDFLISRSNTQELVGLVGIFDENRTDVSFPDTMMRLPVNESIVSKQFLEVVLQSQRGRQHMMRSAAGTSGSMKKINRRTLGTCKIPTPLPEVQALLMSRVDCLRAITGSADAARQSASDVKRALIEFTWGNSK